MTQLVIIDDVLSVGSQGGQFFARPQLMGSGIDSLPIAKRYGELQFPVRSGKLAGRCGPILSTVGKWKLLKRG